MLTNRSTGAQQITKVVIDLDQAALTDRVFWDPAGAGGSAGKGFTVDGRTGTFTVTSSYAGGTSTTGYDQLVLNFGGFDPGEEVRFSIDIDPASLIGFKQSVTSGSVTGVESSGAQFTVTYADGSTQTSEVFGAGGPGAGRALAQPDIDAAPVLTFNGTSSGNFPVSQATQQLAIEGEAGSTVRVLLLTGEMQNVPPSNVFHANTATAVQYLNATLDATGHGAVTITVPQGKPLMVVAAAVDAQGTATSLVSDRLVFALPASGTGQAMPLTVDDTLVFQSAMAFVPQSDDEFAQAQCVGDALPAAAVQHALLAVDPDEPWRMAFDPNTGVFVRTDDRLEPLPSMPLHDMPD